MIEFISFKLKIFVDNRGFMTANGEPDNSRAARYILKDYVNGKLLYCYGPPNVDQEEFHKFEKAPDKREEDIPARTLRAIKVSAVSLTLLFFIRMCTNVMMCSPSM